MADNKVIAASVQVNTDEAVKNMLKLKGTVEDLKKEFKNSAAGSEEQLAAFKKLQVAEQDLAKAHDQLSGSNEKSTGAFAKLKSGLDQLPGATGAAGKGVQGLGDQFKRLLANPIVLIIAAIVTILVALYKAFTSTDEGAQKFQSILDGVGAVIRELTQRAAAFASAVVKFFSGDFKGAMEDSKAAVTGFGDAMVDAFKRGKEASDLLDEVADATRVLDIQYAALNAKLAKSKELLTDENATYAEKKKALQESGEDIDKYYKKKAELDDKQLNALAKSYNIEKQLNELRKKGFEEGAEDFDNYLQKLAIGGDGIKKIEDAITASIASNKEFSAKQRQQNKAEQTLDRQEAAKLKEERMKAAEEEKKRKQQVAEYENKLAKLQQENYLATVKDGYLKESVALRNKIDDDKRQNEEAYKEKKISIEQLNVLNNELEVQQQAQQDALREKYRALEKTKEAAYQKELTDIQTKIRLAGIKDTRALELEQLKIGYEDKLKQAQDRYKDDKGKLAGIEAALDMQYRNEKAEREKKFQQEDDKKKLDQQVAAQEQIYNNDKATLDAKSAALDAEQQLLANAYNNKVILEEDYGKRVQDLTEKRKKILELETAHRKAQATEAADVLDKLSEIIGKKTIAGKALAIAAATINTFQGASEALKQPSTLPSPFDVVAKIVNVAAVIAAGLKTVKSIVDVQVPGGSGGGQAPAAPSISAPLAPVQSSTSLDQGTINNIGNAAAGGINNIRAYVVEQDSAAVAARAQRLQGAAVLGG